MSVQHPPEPTKRDYDEAVEALRHGLNSLPRYSFIRDENGGVRSVQDKGGRFIEWSSAHELFDPEMVDMLLTKFHAHIAIAKAKGGTA